MEKAEGSFPFDAIESHVLWWLNAQEQGCMGILEEEWGVGDPLGGGEPPSYLQFSFAENFGRFFFS